MATASNIKANPGTRRLPSGKRAVAAGEAVKLKTRGTTVKSPHTLEFFKVLTDKHGHVSFELVADSFGMSKMQIAETVGVSRAALYKPKRLQSPKAQGRMREMLEIVSRVSEWSGGHAQGMAWYRAEPLPAFGGRTAESLVKDGKATAVRDYLDALTLGGFA